jgi:hypothetical protein
MAKSNVSRSGRAKSGGRAALPPCQCCGVAPNANGRPLSVTFENPDVVSQIHPELLETWGGDPFLAIKDVGFFVRVILPVKLSDGYAVDFGAWLEVHSEDFRTAWRTWNFPEYADLELEGYLANDIAPWGRLPHALVKATVRDMDQVPFVKSSDDESIGRILTVEWPHAEVIGPYADVLRSDPPQER